MLGLSLKAKQIFQTTSREALLLLVFFLGFLWAVLINHLRVEWTLRPEYGYGWAVPFLCAFLIWKKFEPKTIRTPSTAYFPQFSLGGLYFLTALLALLYLPTRLIQEANPEWGLVSWALALEVVGLTLLLIYFVLGAEWLKRLIFPIAYFLVAVPWPSLLEEPLIQGLTRADASCTVELLGWLGIPAMSHGNVIEVATGEVGINEACSGIRSFQATLMISLFLGELYRLNFPRRLLLVLGGFAMSFGFNLVRMSVLVWVATHYGLNAIAQWHDPTGITILIACFFALWGLGILLAQKKIFIRLLSAETSPTDFSPPKHSLMPLLLALVAWIAMVEIWVEGWYRWHESRLVPAATWLVSWPTNNLTFKDLPLEDTALGMLKCDESRRAGWQENNLQWEAIFIKWNAGTRVQLGHTPNICMTAAGHTLTTVSPCTWFDVGGFHLPFVVYQVADAPQPFYIFYSMWNDQFSAEGLATKFLSLYGNRLVPVLMGLRNPGQRSLEIALIGALDPAQAEAALQKQLQSIIHVEPLEVPTRELK